MEESSNDWNDLALIMPCACRAAQKRGGGRAGEADAWTWALERRREGFGLRGRGLGDLEVLIMPCSAQLEGAWGKQGVGGGKE